MLRDGVWRCRCLEDSATLFNASEGGYLHKHEANKTRFVRKAGRNGRQKEGRKRGILRRASDRALIQAALSPAAICRYDKGSQERDICKWMVGWKLLF